MKDPKYSSDLIRTWAFRQLTDKEYLALCYSNKVRGFKKVWYDRSAISGLAGRGVKAEKVFRKAASGEHYVLRYARLMGGKFKRRWVSSGTKNVAPGAHTLLECRFYWALRRPANQNYPVRILDERYFVPDLCDGG